MADIQNLDIKDFQLYSSVDDNDRVLMAKIDGTDGAITIALLRLQLGAEVKPSIKDGQWYIGKINTNVIAEGKTPEFRTGPEGIECRYVGEDDNAWRVLVGYDKLKLKFTDLTPAQKEELRLKFADLSEADIAELQKPARDVIAVVTKTNTDIKSVEQLRVSAEQARVAAEQGRVTAEQNRVTECGQAITATNTAKEAAITETAKTKLATQAADIATGKLNMALGEVVAAAELAEAAAGSVGEAKAAALGAAVNANNAATNANGAATNANEKAVAAGNAATSANNAAENANSQADAANGAATAANNAATGANAAKDAANGAAASANNAATGANAAKDAANAAAEAANNAATGANAAKDAANTSAVNANSKAAEAGQAATDADAAAQRAREAAAAAEAKSITKQEVENVLTGEIGSHTHKWEKVTDKPDTFPPATHEHGEYLPRAGGTMTGALEVLSQAGGSHGGAIEIRERDLVGEQQLDWDYSPALSFHWGWRYAVRLGLRSDGAMAIDDAVIWHGNNSNTNATDWNVKDLFAKALYMNGVKAMSREGDWLFINGDGGAFGVYFGEKKLRTDGRLEAGPDGGWFGADRDGVNIGVPTTSTKRIRISGGESFEIIPHHTHNATGTFWYNQDGSKVIAGAGALTTGDLLHCLYMGWGESPFDSTKNFAVSDEFIRYKGIDVSLAGHTHTRGQIADFPSIGTGDEVNFCCGAVAGDITTAQFLDKLVSFGAFNSLVWTAKTTWAYDYNDRLVDTGCGLIQLAGVVVEVIGTNKDLCTVTVYTSPTTSNGGVTNAVFVYRNHGENYSPEWRRLANTTDIKAAIDNLQIGGRNLLRNSGNWKAAGWNGGVDNNGGGYAIDPDVTYNGMPTVRTLVGSGLYHPFIPLENGVEYTYSAMVRCNETIVGQPTAPLHWHAGLNNTNQGKCQVLKYDTSVVANEWRLIHVVFKLIDDANSYRPFFYWGANGTTMYWIAYMKLEKGNKPTDWTPAPEDTTSKHKSATLPASGWVASGADWACTIADGDVQDGVTITGDADGDTCDTFDAARIYKSVAAVGSFTLYAKNKPAGSINLLYTIQA